MISTSTTSMIPRSDGRAHQGRFAMAAAPVSATVCRS
jgi:hypothetical protein